MDTSVLLNWIFGGGLLAALTALVTLGPTVRKAKAEAEKAKADAETVRIDNTEHATRILIENIDRKSTRLNSSHMPKSRMPSSA